MLIRPFEKRRHHQLVAPVILAAFALITASPVHAKDVPTVDTNNVVADEGEEIIVNGIRFPVVLTAKQVAGALEEFEKWRSRFAPNTTLAFRVGMLGGATREGLALRLRSNDEDLPIELVDGRRFVIPEHGRGDWAVYANRNNKTMIIEPFILSPGTDEFNRRMGDLRLQCRVYWGTVRSQTSLIVKGMYGAAGGCGSKKFAYYILSSKPISSAIITTEGRDRSIKISRQRIYNPPIAEKTVGDDAMLKLQ